MAPILNDISRDLGGILPLLTRVRQSQRSVTNVDKPEYGSSNVNWVGIVYSLAQAVVLMLAGRLSDIFGRRWFFIIGSCIGLIGSIVGGTSGSLEQLIAGETLIGIAAGFQCSFFWVVAEIVPMKRRFIANAGLFLWTLPTVNPHPFHSSPTPQRLGWLMEACSEYPWPQDCCHYSEQYICEMAWVFLLLNRYERTISATMVLLLPPTHISHVAPNEKGETLDYGLRLHWSRSLFSWDDSSTDGSQLGRCKSFMSTTR